MAAPLYLDLLFEALPDPLVPPEQRAAIRQLGHVLPESAFTGRYGLELRLGTSTEHPLTDFACSFTRSTQNRHDLSTVRLPDHFDDIDRYRAALHYLYRTRGAGLGQLADDIWLEFDATEAGFHRAPGLFFYVTPQDRQAWTRAELYDQVRTALDEMPGFDANSAAGAFYRRTVRTVVERGRLQGFPTVQMAWLFGRDTERMRLCMRLEDRNAAPDLLDALDLAETAQATREALAPYQAMIQGGGLTLNVGTDVDPRIGMHLVLFRRGVEGQPEAERWLQVLVEQGHATPEEAEALLQFQGSAAAPIDPDRWPLAFEGVSRLRYSLVTVPYLMHLKLVVAPGQPSAVKVYLINRLLWRDAFTWALLPLRAVVTPKTMLEPLSS